MHFLEIVQNVYKRRRGRGGEREREMEMRAYTESVLYRPESDNSRADERHVDGFAVRLAGQAAHLLPPPRGERQEGSLGILAVVT
jgi:hypothetical protein